MEFSSSANDYVGVASNDYQRWEVKSAARETAETTTETPKTCLYPPGFLPRYPMRGHSPRKKRPRHSPYDRCPLYHRHHHRNFESPYDFHHDGYGDHCLYSSLKRNKAMKGYSSDRRIYRDEADDFGSNTFKFKSNDYAISSDDCLIDRNRDPFITRQIHVPENVMKNSELMSPESHTKLTDLDPYGFETGYGSKNNCLQKKKKWQSAEELVEHQSVNAISSHGNYSLFPQNSDGSQNFIVSSSNGGIEQINNKLETAINAQNIPSETSLAVQNLQLSYPYPLSSLNQSFQNVQENQVAEYTTTQVDQNTTHKPKDVSDAFSLLNDIIAEMGESDTPENRNREDIKKEQSFVYGNSAVMPYSGGSVSSFEASLTIPNNPIASLIQQNQILTDLLSKVISNSELFKTGNEYKMKAPTVIEPDSNTYMNTNSFGTSEMKIVPLNDFSYFSGNESQPMKLTASELNNGVAVSTSSCGNFGSSQDIQSISQIGEIEITNNDCNGYQIHILDSSSCKPDNSCLDIITIENVSEVGTNLNSTPNYVSDNQAINKVTLKEEITPESFQQLGEGSNGADAVVETEKVKMEVGKSNTPKKNLSRLKALQAEDSKNHLSPKKCQVKLKPISRSSSNSSGTSSCSQSVQNQNEGNDRDSRYVAVERVKSKSKPRKLRSKMKNSSQNETTIQCEVIEIDVSDTKPSRKGMERELDALLCCDIYPKRRKEVIGDKMSDQESVSSDHSSKTNLNGSKKRSVSKKR